MNNPKLKLAMAKLLPDQIDLEPLEPSDIPDTPVIFVWKNKRKGWPEHWTQGVLETEWLYVMQLVEESLTDLEHGQYVGFLIKETCIKEELNEWNRNRITCDSRRAYCSATFNQRATAMCKVKGIEI